MQSEIERVLGMVKDGMLTPEQAAEMIVALKDAIGTDASDAHADSAAIAGRCRASRDARAAAASQRMTCRSERRCRTARR